MNDKKSTSGKAVVIGGGASGMLCSVFLAKNGFDVTVIEQNEKLGKKLYITGKGRCNITNDCSETAFFSHVVTNPRFLYSAYHMFNSQDMLRTLSSWGLKTKIERGSRAFPESDHSADVIDTLKNKMKSMGVKVILNTKVKEIITHEFHADDSSDEELNDTVESGDMNKTNSSVNEKEKPHKKAVEKTRQVYGVRTSRGEYEADRVIVSTGGLSYPSTGSDGSGYKFAGNFGLAVTECIPSLVEILTDDYFTRELEGLSLKNVTLSVRRNKKTVFSEFGEMLFTKHGISGPLVLSASSILGRMIGTEKLDASIDLKPAVDDEKLDQHILRLFSENANKNLDNAIRDLYPASLVPVILSVSGTDPLKKAHDITKEERQKILNATKAFPLHLKKLGGFEEAVITKGGVSVKEINPKTMESKKIEGLYFTGEVIDVDALTGGFNLQIAWSTAYAAGNA